MKSVSVKSNLLKYPRLTIAIFVWLNLVLWLSMSGDIERLGNFYMPFYALLVSMGIAMPLLVYKSSPAFKEDVDALGISGLTKFHVWRIPAGLMFIYYGLNNELPLYFWVLAGIGDFIAGMMAIKFWRGANQKSQYKLFHVFGMFDFVVAVGAGLTYTLLGNEKMILLTTLPMSLIPLFGVGLSGASHVIALQKLFRK